MVGGAQQVIMVSRCGGAHVGCGIISDLADSDAECYAGHIGSQQKVQASMRKARQCCQLPFCSLAGSPCLPLACGASMS